MLYSVLNARVLALGVLANDDSVDLLVRGLVALNRAARPDVGVQVELPAIGSVCVCGGGVVESTR